MWFGAQMQSRGTGGSKARRPESAWTLADETSDGGHGSHARATDPNGRELAPNHYVRRLCEVSLPHGYAVVAKRFQFKIPGHGRSDIAGVRVRSDDF